MISYKVNDIPKFMSLLFSSETFDGMFLSEAVIKTFSTFSVDGHTNCDFYDDTVTPSKYAEWATLRPFCRDLIKGKRIPVSMRFSFIIPDETKVKLFSDNSYNGPINDISFLFNIVFEGNSLKIISATSASTFIFDREYEKIWDAGFKVMLTSAGINFDEE